MFRWDVVWHYLFQDPNLLFLKAAWTTLWISVIAQALGVVLGLFLALARMSKKRWLNLPSSVYIWFFRGSPLLVQVLLLWDGLPKIFPALLLPDWACVLVAFSLNEAAYMAEITRASISSVDTGQMEAGRALGMTYPLAMRRIVLPQAARVIIPPLGNEFNNMLKSTSIASVIGLLELTGTAEVYGSQAFNIFELLIVATVFYLILTSLWEIVQRRIENSLNPDRVKTVAMELSQKSLVNRAVGINLPRIR